MPGLHLHLLIVPPSVNGSKIGISIAPLVGLFVDNPFVSISNSKYLEVDGNAKARPGREGCNCMHEEASGSPSV